MGLLDMIFGPRVAQISVREAYERLQQAEPPLIVDVRQPLETASGTVPGAVLIPLTDFAGHYEELPKDRPILTICRSSHRSPFAARQLKKAGYEVIDVKGGMAAWERAGLPVEKPT